MLRSTLMGLATAAALFLIAPAASAADACKTSFDDYGDPNASVACDCPALAAPGIVYGTLVYTSDSDVCTAARHAGQIDANAGTVKLRGTGGCQSYPGSTRNGVTTETWGAWDRSFYFPGTHDGSCQVDASATPTPGPAAPAPAPAGDALSIVLALMQAAPPGAFTYGNATSLGADAFEFTDVVLVPEGPDSKVTIGKMRVENLDLAGVLQGGMPAHARLVLENMLLTPENSDMDGDVWEMLGTNSAMTNLVLDYTMDAATRGFTLKDFTIDVQGIGKGTLAFDLSGVGPEAIMAPEAALFQGSLKSASFTFVDETLLARTLAAGMKETGQPEDVVVQIALQELANSLGEMGAQPGDRFFDAASKLGGMLLDAKSPKGPLTISVAPAQPVSFMQLNQLESPGAAADALNLQATYAGSSATLPAPVVSQDTSTGAAFVYTDKDAYASGETVVVFWDGTPGNATDWVNVVPAGSPPNDWGQFAYTNGQVSGSVEFHGLTPGQYEARVFYNYPDGGFVPQSTYSFTVQ